MSLSWVNDDVTIIERLKERYLKAECIELNSEHTGFRGGQAVGQRS